MTALLLGVAVAAHVPVLLWGAPESLRDIKGLIALIEQAQQQQKMAPPAGSNLSSAPN